MIASEDSLNSAMINSLSTISTHSSSSTTSFEDAKCGSQAKLAEEQSIFNEASLAQAEYDDDDLEEDSERSKRSLSNFEYVDDEHSDDLSNAENSKRSNFNNEPHLSNFNSKSEETRNEAKEYWATIDFYNNSKMAFNKRLKSVKLKREKLNFELNERSAGQFDDHNHERNNANDSQTDLCNCVKCSIIIHEALIQGLQNVHEILCKNCHSKSNTCKCNLSNRKSISKENSVWENDKTLSSIDQDFEAKSRNLNKFEEKLFNIKNELINLSETSLDVFHLLLQLSDTVLDLNNQLSSSTNVTQFFFSNSNSNVNQNLFSTNEHKTEIKKCQNREKNLLSKESKSNKIESFLQKKFYSTQSEASPTNKDLNNSITSIINKINNRSSNSQKIEQLKKVSSSKSRSNSPTLTNNQTRKLIENIYDKTSVTQFVDSLLNSKSGEDLSRASSGFYSATSLLTMINQEESSNTSFSDTSQSFSIKQTPNIKLSSTTNTIIARQIKNPSSSNIDLSETKSFRHSTLSTSSSNTDSSIEKNKFMTIESSKSKDNYQANSAVSELGTNKKNLGSNNTLSSSSSCTSPVPSIILNGARKPSFKFENNTILNKVQNMNIKNKYSTPQYLNDICESSTLDKRCSLNRETNYGSERYAIKRQQSVKCQHLAQTPVRSQSSLDSGINLTSENEESKMVSGVK